MDIYELLGEDRDAPQHRHARLLVDAQDQLMRDLVATRERAGLTQTQVAALMGTDQATVSRFESRTVDPRMSTLRRYAAAVGARIDYAVTSYPDPDAAVTMRTVEPYTLGDDRALGEGGL